MAEYLIEIVQDTEVTHVVNVNIQNRKEATLSIASAAGYHHCTKFKVEKHALKVAAKFTGSRVVPSFGGYVNSTKSSVAPLANKVNGATPYRSI